MSRRQPFRRGVASSLTVFAALAAAACASAAAPPSAPPPPRPVVSASVPAPPSATVDPLSTPPPPGPVPQASLPPIRHFELPNGMKLRVVARESYPLVELRLVVFSGSASDGTQAGVASVAGELLKAGGAGPYGSEALVERAEALGTRLDVTTDRDSTRIALGVTATDFEPALALLAAVAEEPRFSPPEFVKLKQREIERVKDAETGDAGWAASMLLYRRLYHLAGGTHPYSRYDATAGELERLSLAACKDWYGAHFSPKNALLVVAGDVDPARVESAVRARFESWKGDSPPPLSYPTPLAPSDPTVWLVDRPHSAQSEIYVGAFGPERVSPDWPAFAAASEILGGGVASRLFLDVREKQSLAYHTGVSPNEPAHGAAPFVLSAGTQTPKTALTLKALLDNLHRMIEAPPSSTEVATASRSLSDRLLFGTERLDDIAALTAKLALLGLPDDYFTTYDRELAALDPKTVYTAARRYDAVQIPIMVVAGDASVVGAPLSHFGRVEIVDPERDFVTLRELPRDEHAPLEPGSRPGGSTPNP